MLNTSKRPPTVLYYNTLPHNQITPHHTPPLQHPDNIPSRSRRWHIPPLAKKSRWHRLPLALPHRATDPAPANPRCRPPSSKVYPQPYMGVATAQHKRESKGDQKGTKTNKPQNHDYQRLATTKNPPLSTSFQNHNPHLHHTYKKQKRRFIRTSFPYPGGDLNPHAIADSRF